MGKKIQASSSIFLSYKWPSAASCQQLLLFPLPVWMAAKIPLSALRPEKRGRRGNSWILVFWSSTNKPFVILGHISSGCPLLYPEELLTSIYSPCKLVSFCTRVKGHWWGCTARYTRCKPHRNEERHSLGFHQIKPQYVRIRVSETLKFWILQVLFACLEPGQKNWQKNVGIPYGTK